MTVRWGSVESRWQHPSETAGGGGRGIASAEPLPASAVTHLAAEGE